MMMTIIQRNTSLTILKSYKKTSPGPLIPFWRGYLYMMKLFNKNVVEIIIQIIS